MTALLEKFKVDSCKQKRMGEKPYNGLVLRVAIGEDDKTKMSDVRDILRTAGKTLDDFEGDVEDCRRRISLVDLTLQEDAAKKMTAKHEKRIKEIGPEINELCRPLMEEKNRLVGKRNQQSQKAISAAGARAKLFNNPPVWLKDRKKKVLAKLNEIRPRCEYLANTRQHRSTMVEDLIAKVASLTKQILPKLPTGDFEAARMREQLKSDRTVAQEKADRLKSQHESEAGEFIRLKNEVEDLQGQIDRLNEISVSLPWPTESDL